MSRLFGGTPRQVLAVDDDPARVGAVEAGHEPKRGRLAAAARAEQRDELAGLEREVDALQRIDRPERAPQLLQLDVRHLTAPDPTRTVRLPPRPSDEQQREHRRPGDAEAHQRHGRRRVGLRLVDVLDVGGEGVERRQGRDRELAHHDREREEGAAKAQRRGCSGGSRAPASCASSRRGSATPRSACARRWRGNRRRARSRCTGTRGSRRPPTRNRSGLPRNQNGAWRSSLKSFEQPDDEDDRRHDERDEREEPDHRPQARQLQVHPVDRRHEEQQPDDDRLEREPERDLDRRPELRVVEDHAVGGEAAALPGLGVLDAEQEAWRPAAGGSTPRRAASQTTADGAMRGRLHLDHLDARRCIGT